MEKDKMNSREAQAIFRLGQMDMQEDGDSLYGMARAALLDAAERVRGMEVKL